MMQITTDALVLRVNNIGDSDRLITLLTKEYGVIKAFASGAKKLKSKYYAGTSHLSYSHFIIEAVKDTYRVRDASLNTSFFKIGCDISLISLQQYFCELSEVLAPMDSTSDAYLRLLLNSLYTVNSGKMYKPLLKSVFELRILSLSGYTPDLIACFKCGEFDKDVFFFNPLESVIACDTCADKNKELIMLDRTLLSAMRHIIYCDFEKLFSFKIPNESADRLSKITEKYLLSQTEQNFSTLNFYNSII